MPALVLPTWMQQHFFFNNKQTTVLAVPKLGIKHNYIQKNPSNTTSMEVEITSGN